MTNYIYTYFRVSKSEDLATSAHRYKELRLRALELSPSSFASTYDIEATFPDEYWVSRLTQTGRETFICAATPTAEPKAEPEWVAQMTFLGPQSIEDFTLPAESSQPAPVSDEFEERWQMLALFTQFTYRGKGIAKVLTRKALEYLVSYRDEPKCVSVRLTVKPGMVTVVSLYLQLGFIDVGKCTLAEALIANGDQELLPNDYLLQEKYTARTGYLMIKQITRDE
jgi:ribosomal protein S18 acetylase RimI-like enzyme